MDKELPKDSIALTKGANSKIREWYLKNLGKNNRLFMPSFKSAIIAMQPYEKREEGMKL